MSSKQLTRSRAFNQKMSISVKMISSLLDGQKTINLNNRTYCPEGNISNNHVRSLEIVCNPKQKTSTMQFNEPVHLLNPQNPYF